MKRVTVFSSLVAFATLTALQAAEPSVKTPAASCDKAQASCCSAKAASSKAAATGSCCSASTRKVVRKNVDVKGATLLVRR